MFTQSIEEISNKMTVIVMNNSAVVDSDGVRCSGDEAIP